MVKTPYFSSAASDNYFRKYNIDIFKFMHVLLWYVSSSAAIITTKLVADEIPGGIQRLFFAVSFCSFMQLAGTFIFATLCLAAQRGSLHFGCLSPDTDTLKLVDVGKLFDGAIHTRALAGLWHCLGTSSANWATITLGASASQFIKLLEPAAFFLFSPVFQYGAYKSWCVLALFEYIWSVLCHLYLQHILFRI